MLDLPPTLFATLVPGDELYICKARERGFDDVGRQVLDSFVFLCAKRCENTVGAQWVDYAGLCGSTLQFLF